MTRVVDWLKKLPSPVLTIPPVPKFASNAPDVATSILPVLPSPPLPFPEPQDAKHSINTEASIILAMRENVFIYVELVL